MAPYRNPETERKHARSRAEVIRLLGEKPRLFVSVVTMSITHRFAYLRFHEDDCPFFGFGVMFPDVESFEGQVLRSGPHTFRVSEKVDEQDDGKKKWHLQSEDGLFRIVAGDILLEAKEEEYKKSLQERKRRR